MGVALTHHQTIANSESTLRKHQDCIALTGLVYDNLPGDLGSMGRVRRYAKGDLLWTLNTERHEVFFLKRGQVVILLNNSDGYDVIVRVIKPGEPFGELCFCSLRYQPRENCAQAVVDSEVFGIDLPAFLTYLRSHSDALEAFTFTICKRLAEAQDRIQVLSHRGAEARLGRLLLQLARSRTPEKAAQPEQVKLALGHDELARMAAMTRPHVSVMMGKLRGLGLVSYSRGSQLTIQIDKLEKYLHRESPATS